MIWLMFFGGLALLVVGLLVALVAILEGKGWGRLIGVAMAIVVIVGGVLLMVRFTDRRYDQRKAACEAKGGEWYRVPRGDICIGADHG